VIDEAIPRAGLVPCASKHQGVEIVDRDSEMFAPGWPGIPPRWTSSAKSGLGTAVSRDSRVWFTLSHGILNEIYYPRVDHACTRDLGFIVTDGQTYFSEEKRDARSDRRHTRATLPSSAACRKTLNRQAVNRTCSPFVIASPIQAMSLNRRAEYVTRVLRIHRSSRDKKSRATGDDGIHRPSVVRLWRLAMYRPPSDRGSRCVPSPTCP